MTNRNTARFIGVLGASIFLFFSFVHFTFAGTINDPQYTGVPFTPICDIGEVYVAISSQILNGTINPDGSLALSFDSVDYPDQYEETSLFLCGTAFNINYTDYLAFEFYTNFDINSGTNIGYFSTIPYAYTYTRDTNKTEEYTPLTISVSFRESDVSSTFVGDSAWCVIMYGQDGWYAPRELPIINTGEPYSGTFTYDLPIGEVITDVYAYGMPDPNVCTDVGSGGGAMEFEGYGFTQFTVLANNIWNSENGFWGSTTPGAIIGDMTASVQNTGANLWPLLAFVGVPIAFIIALYLIFMINQTLTPEKKKDEFSIDEFNKKADELQAFYSKTGESGAGYDYSTVVKRKRGRPRKNPIQ